MCGGIKKREPVAQKIWEGEIRGTKLRILQVAENDCYVEELVPPSNIRVDTRINTQLSFKENWQAAEDELASEAYMTAFLEAHKLLKSVADFAVGNRP
jgi:hypothetical protein